VAPICLRCNWSATRNSWTVESL